MRVRVAVTRKSRIPKVVKQLNSARIRILFQNAGYLRRVARSSIKSASRSKKKRGVSSQPGSTPLNHRGGAGIRRTISFQVDRIRGFAVVGYERGRNPGIPKALERGGTTRAVSFRKMRTQRIAARPVMKPGLRKSIQKFRQITRDEFRKALR